MVRASWARESHARGEPVSRQGSGIVDDRVFDRLAKTVGQGSRRAVMLGALTGAIGLAVLDANESQSESKHKSIQDCIQKSSYRKRKRCCRDIDNDRKRRKCLKAITLEPCFGTDGDCPGGRVCSGGQCMACLQRNDRLRRGMPEIRLSAQQISSTSSATTRLDASAPA